MPVVEADYPRHAPEATTGSQLSSNIAPENNFISLEEYVQELGANTRSQRWAISNPEFIGLVARTKDELEANNARKDVAAHELGHAHVVRALGHSVEEISIIPNGRVLGFTRFRLRALRDIVQSITHRIACAAGSRIAEEKVGVHDHCGCGGDDAQIRALAMAGERYTGGLYSSSWLESEGRKLARSAMAAYSALNLERDATKLLVKYPVLSSTEPIKLRKKIINLPKVHPQPTQKAA